MDTTTIDQISADEIINILSNIIQKTHNHKLKKQLEEKRIMSKKVAIYCRVSTTEQAEEGYSIDEQNIKIRNTVKEKVMKYTTYMKIEV